MTEMGEEDWLACTDPDEMAIWIYYESKNRNWNWGCKLKHVLHACVRRIWHLLPDDELRRNLEASERLDDTTEEDFPWDESSRLSQAAHEGWFRLAEAAAAGQYGSPLLRAMSDAGCAAWQAVDGDTQCLKNASEAAANFAAERHDPRWQQAKATEQQAQVEIIRRFFGNPFREIA